MKIWYAVIFTILSGLSVGFATLQTDFSKVRLAPEKVSGNVYIIQGVDEAAAFTGGNIAVSVGEDGVVLIDTKMAPLTDKIKAAISEIGYGAPTFIINTHVHGDHTGGNAAFSSEGTIIAHKNSRTRLLENKPKEFWPVITFDQSLSVYLNGEDIDVIHYPKGHTDGDAVIYFKSSNVVHAGDHYFSGLFPFVDLNRGGSVQGFMENVKSILDVIDDSSIIIPGHGPISNKADLSVWRAMLAESVDIVVAAMNSGKRLEEIKIIGLPEKMSGLSWDFVTTEKWIETIYTSYSTE